MFHKSYNNIQYNNILFSSDFHIKSALARQRLLFTLKPLDDVMDCDSII